MSLASLVCVARAYKKIWSFALICFFTSYPALHAEENPCGAVLRSVSSDFDLNPDQEVDVSFNPAAYALRGLVQRNQPHRHYDQVNWRDLIGSDVRVVFDRYRLGIPPVIYFSSSGYVVPQRVYGLEQMALTDHPSVLESIDSIRRQSQSTQVRSVWRNRFQLGVARPSAEYFQHPEVADVLLISNAELIWSMRAVGSPTGLREQDVQVGPDVVEYMQAHPETTEVVTTHTHPGTAVPLGGNDYRSLFRTRDSMSPVLGFEPTLRVIAVPTVRDLDFVFQTGIGHRLYYPQEAEASPEE